MRESTVSKKKNTLWKVSRRYRGHFEIFEIKNQLFTSVSTVVEWVTFRKRRSKRRPKKKRKKNHRWSFYTHVLYITWGSDLTNFLKKKNILLKPAMNEIKRSLLRSGGSSSCVINKSWPNFFVLRFIFYIFLTWKSKTQTRLKETLFRFTSGTTTTRNELKSPVCVSEGIRSLIRFLSVFLKNQNALSRSGPLPLLCSQYS